MIILKGFMFTLKVSKKQMTKLMSAKFKEKNFDPRYDIENSN